EHCVCGAAESQLAAPFALMPAPNRCRFGVILRRRVRLEGSCRAERRCCGLPLGTFLPPLGRPRRTGVGLPELAADPCAHGVEQRRGRSFRVSWTIVGMLTADRRG